MIPASKSLYTFLERPKPNPSDLISTSVFASNESIDLLNDAKEVARYEIRDVNSGNYSGYRSETMRSIIIDIKNSISEAKNSTDSVVTRDLIDLTNKQIEIELNDSYNYRKYRLETVKNIMSQIDRTLSLAVKYDRR